MSEPSEKSGEITRLLKNYSDGDGEAMNELVPFVYEELRRQARRHLYRERPNHTLQTTALVHEAYLRLVEQKSVNWQNRAHFFGIAATMMRRILVNYARKRTSQKRGGAAEDLPLEDISVGVEDRDVDLLALDDALDGLSALDERQARIVELRYFSGLTIKETAEVLDISPTTVKREWRMAKAWLRAKMS